MGDGAVRVGAGGGTPDSFTIRAREVFDRVDADSDGYLSESELEDAVHSRSFQGHDAAAVQVMFERQDDLEEVSDDEWGDENDGITRSDLNALAGSELSGAESAYDSAASRIDNAEHRLFPDGLASITPRAVVQGRYNDCYFLAAVAGLAESNPRAIQQMITDNGNGNYTVRFPGRDPVSVTLTDAELVKASGTRDGAWVAVLEQAYMDHVDSLADYGGLTGGIEALTGGDTDTYVVSSVFSADSVRTPVREALAEGRLITTSRTWTSGGDLPSQHVYAIIGYDAASDSFRIRNPHGSEVNLTVEQFQRQFDLVAIQER